MNRGVDRLNIFDDDRDRKRFLALVGDATSATDVRVGAYCLMGNHFHLLLHCPSGGLSKTMGLLGSRYVRWFNDRHGRDGPLFRSRFTSKFVADERYLAHLLTYIHRNPRDLGVQPHRWQWSSLAAYTGGRRPPDWLTVDELMPLIGGIDEHVEAVGHPMLAADHAEPDLLYISWQAERAAELVDHIARSVAAKGASLSRRDRETARLVVAHRLGVRADQLASIDEVSSGAIRMRLQRAARAVDSNSALASFVAQVMAHIDDPIGRKPAA